MLCKGQLAEHYKCNFSLMHHFKYSLSDLNEMYPFEREIYQILLIQHLNEQKEKNGK